MQIFLNENFVKQFLQNKSLSKITIKNCEGFRKIKLYLTEYFEKNIFNEKFRNNFLQIKNLVKNFVHN